MRNLLQYLIVVCALALGGVTSRAHLTYGGRDLGSFSGLTNGSTTITNQAVTGNYGWADAADGILGDSHRGRAFRFRLNDPAFVSITVSANAGATTNSIGGLIPAFSVYSGLGAVTPFPPSQTTNQPSADHDSSESANAWRTWWVQQNLDPMAEDASATDGCWNALGDWKIGGDGDLPGDFSSLSSFIYKGSAAATSGNRVTGSLSLAAGDYTLFIGGNDIANKISGTALVPHGIAVTLSVASTPILSIASKVFVPRPSGAAASWTLQSASTADSNDWKNVTTSEVTVDGQEGVVLDVGAAQGYFRFVQNP